MYSDEISFVIFKILFNNVIHIHFTDDEIEDHEANGSARKFQNWNSSHLATYFLKNQLLKKYLLEL